MARQLQIAKTRVHERNIELKHRFAAPRGQDRLKLLMLISRPPIPPMSGCYLRWWAMIRFLGQRHDLTLVTFCSSEQSRQLHQLLRFCRSIYAASWGGAELPGSQALPYIVRTRRRSTMRDALRAIPTHLYDVALIEQIVLAKFYEEIDVPAMLGEHNIESELLKQAAQSDVLADLTDTFDNPQHEAELLRDHEDRMWPQFAVRSAVSPRERDEIQRRSKTGQTILVENGTNPDLWLEIARPDTDRIVFFGALGYYPNIDGVLYFWQSIWPHLVRRRPSLNLIVAGTSAAPELRELKSQPGFTLIEDPPDIREIAALASLSIVPLRLGGGTRLKILDSMALGLPVVSTSLGCAGLAIEDGEQLLIRDDPVAFAEAIDELLSDRSLWQRLRRNGKIAVEERYSWNRVLAPLEPALFDIAR
jgi:glycosyltransferase involved in cell wall biosynthesis